MVVGGGGGVGREECMVGGGVRCSCGCMLYGRACTQPVPIQQTSEAISQESLGARCSGATCMGCMERGGCGASLCVACVWELLWSCHRYL
jgi:hypothetical protein